MNTSHTNYRAISLILSVIMIITLIPGCGKTKESSFADQVAQMTPQPGADNDTDTGNAPDKAESGSISDKISDMADEIKETAGEDADEEIEIDPEWQEILMDNGTIYDAFYEYAWIIDEESPTHTDDVKLPAGLSKQDYSYYEKSAEELDHSDLAPGDMDAVAGIWLPGIAKIMDIESDFGSVIAAGVDKHLILNADGSGECNVWDVDSELTWTPEYIHLNKPLECDWTYELSDDGNELTTWYTVMGIGQEWEVHYIRKEFYESTMYATVQTGDHDLGKKLPEEAKMYELVCIVDGDTVSKATEGDPALDPKDNYLVLVETDKTRHGGYGYFRRENEDTPIYYQSNRNLAKTINENTADRSRGMDHTRIETEDKDIVKLWPDYQHDPDLHMEYQLSDASKIPVSHVSLGPVENRDFEIPEGSHDKAGFYHLDRIPLYMYRFKDTFYGDPEHFTDLWNGLDDVVFGTDTRKYDCDIWYVLDEDGTGYMRIMRNYFELAWCDDEIYYYDASGRHKLGNVPGEIDFDSCFVRLFLDEINPVPERPVELGGPGGYRPE